MEMDFLYDPSGQRIKKTYSEGGLTLSESIYVNGFYTQTDGKTHKHISDGQYIIATKVDNVDDDILYYTSNNIGSTVMLTDKESSLTQEFMYTPYSETFVELGSSEIDRLFTGQIKDKESGLYYYNNRYYDEQIGTFTRPDPAMDGLNHYGYVYGNPVKYNDPTGLCGDCTVIGFGSQVIHRYGNGGNDNSSGSGGDSDSSSGDDNSNSGDGEESGDGDSSSGDEEPGFSNTMTLYESPSLPACYGDTNATGGGGEQKQEDGNVNKILELLDSSSDQRYRSLESDKSTIANSMNFSNQPVYAIGPSSTFAFAFANANNSTGIYFVPKEDNKGFQAAFMFLYFSLSYSPVIGPGYLITVLKYLITNSKSWGFYTNGVSATVFNASTVPFVTYPDGFTAWDQSTASIALELGIFNSLDDFKGLYSDFGGGVSLANTPITIGGNIISNGKKIIGYSVEVGVGKGLPGEIHLGRPGVTWAVPLKK